MLGPYTFWAHTGLSLYCPYILNCLSSPQPSGPDITAGTQLLWSLLHFAPTEEYPSVNIQPKVKLYLNPTLTVRPLTPGRHRHHSQGHEKIPQVAPCWHSRPEDNWSGTQSQCDNPGTMWQWRWGCRLWHFHRTPSPQVQASCAEQVEELARIFAVLLARSTSPCAWLMWYSVSPTTCCIRPIRSARALVPGSQKYPPTMAILPPPWNSSQDVNSTCVWETCIPSAGLYKDWTQFGVILGKTL